MLNIFSFFSSSSHDGYMINDPTTPDLIEKVQTPSLGFLKYNINNLSFEPKNKAERQALNCYITIGNCINYIQKNSKIPIRKWAATPSLQVVPQAGNDLNAYYDRSSLKFFYYKSRGTIMFTADSSDVVSHELGHAILDAIRPDFWSVQSLEVWSFHEAFSDIVALVSIMQYDSIIKKSLVETNNDLSKSNSITKLAEEFGILIYKMVKNKNGYMPDCLRNPAIERFKYVDPNTLPVETANNKLAAECHSFGRVFSAAWYDIFVKVYEKELLKVKDPVQAVKNSRDICFSFLLQAIPESALVVSYYSSIAKSMINVAKIKKSEYLSIIKKTFEDWNIIKPLKIMSNITWKDVVYNLKKEDSVVKNENFKIVKISNKKLIKLNKISMLSSNSLNNVEIEVPNDQYYEFDKNGNLVDEIINNQIDIENSAKICLQFVEQSINNMWSIKEGKLIRNFIS